MTITELYKYSWFSTLSYVKWSEAEDIADNAIDTEPEDLILAANANKRLPGEAEGAPDTLGEKIFNSVGDGGLSLQLA